MLTSVALPTSHHFHPSLSPVVSFSLCILHKWMRTQMLAKPPSNLLQRTGGDHRGGCAQLGWKTFMMTCLRWISRYMRLEIWCKVGLSGDWCLCTALCTRSGACCYWIGWVHWSTEAIKVRGQWGKAPSKLEYHYQINADFWVKINYFSELPT